MTIRINLDDLTQAHIDEAAPFLRHCSYSSPCIIGALIPPELREAADIPCGDSLGVAAIDVLVKSGRVSMPEDQVHAAKVIQEKFDYGDIPALIRILKARGLEWTGVTEEQYEEQQSSG